MKFSCLFFSEGGRDYKFYVAFSELSKFQFHTRKWSIQIDRGSGCSPEVILTQCRRAISGISYDLVMCFIDLDKLKSDYPENWVDEKTRLEDEYSEIIIIWQIENAEDEYRRVLGKRPIGKHRLNKSAQMNVDKFINKSLWKRILKPLKDKEDELG